jgi:hypothetical protein
LEISIIETGKVNRILDLCRPNRLSFGLRRTGINDQIFHLEPRSISFWNAASTSVEGGSAKSVFAPIEPQLTIIRSDSAAGVATDLALAFIIGRFANAVDIEHWTTRRCTAHRKRSAADVFWPHACNPDTPLSTSWRSDNRAITAARAIAAQFLCLGFPHSAVTVIGSYEGMCNFVEDRISDFWLRI